MSINEINEYALKRQEVNESDYLAGSVIRQMLKNIREEGYKAINKKEEKFDYCDYGITTYADFIDYYSN